MNVIKTSNHSWLVLVFLGGLFFSTIGLQAQQYPFVKIGLEQGMLSARVNDFLQDSRGYYWLATQGAGLVRYDGYEFSNFEFPNEEIRPLVSSLAEDGDGRIWASSDYTLIAYDGVGYNYYYLPNTESRIQHIALSGEGDIWVHTEKNLYRKGKRDTLEKIDFPLRGKINSLAWYKKQWYVATDSALFAFNKEIKKGNWQSLQVFNNKLWFGGGSGLWRFDGKGVSQQQSEAVYQMHSSDSTLAMVGTQVLELLSNDKSLPLRAENGLPKEEFNGCFVSKEGLVWLFSNNGLIKLENTAVAFYGKQNGLRDEVLAVHIGERKQFFAGSGKGLSVVSEKGISNFYDEDFPYGVILGIAEYGGKTWLGTESGLIQFNGKQFAQMPLPAALGSFIFSLHGNNEGLWLGTGSGIINYRNGHLQDISRSEGLPPATVYSISEATDKSLWFATYSGGVFRKIGNQFKHLKKWGGLRLDSLQFTNFTPVDSTSFWAATLNDELYWIHNNGYKVFSTQQLKYAEIKSLKVDATGQLWMGTNKGLFTLSVNGESYSLQQVSDANKQSGTAYSPLALAVTDDYVLGGTNEGLVKISRAELEKVRPQTQLALTNVELFFGDVKNVAEYGNGSIPFSRLPNGLQLPHNMNFISFKLAGLGAYHTDELEYRYRIKGGTESWTLAGNRREAVFSNLKPGSYNFEAQVKRKSETWPQSGVNYLFTIQNPVYKRWWFITLLVLVVGGLTGGFIISRVRSINMRLRLQNSLLDMERKALRLQMNPHFIFNALDSISSFIFKNDPKQAVRYLNNFAKLMRLTLESSMEHLHPVETEVSILKNYLELEKLRFKGKFEYEIEVDEEIDYDVGIPPMLIQPHVENAILHGLKPMAEGGFLKISFCLDEEFLICRVEDNGIGREKAKEMPQRKDHRSMATQINEDRLRLLKISMNEEIEMKIEDLKDPTGTRVEIKLPAESI